MLVVDASVVVASCLATGAWTTFRDEELIAPPLAVSESSSVLHEALWRGDLTKIAAEQSIERLAAAPLRIQALQSPLQAWAIAEALGWAKTYDAEYIALARLLGCRLVTLDARLRRGASRLVDVIGPTEL